MAHFFSLPNLLAGGLVVSAALLGSPAQARPLTEPLTEPNVQLQGFACRNVNPYNSRTTVICRNNSNRNDVRYFYGSGGGNDTTIYRDSTTGQTLQTRIGSPATSNSTNLLSPIPGINIQIPGINTGTGVQIQPNVNPNVNAPTNTGVTNTGIILKAPDAVVYPQNGGTGIQILSPGPTQNPGSGIIIIPAQ